jgi:hypothetical protein
MTCFLDTTSSGNSMSKPDWVRPSWIKPAWLQPACLVLVTWTAMAAASDHAAAANRKARASSSSISIAERAAGAPIMAIVSLRSQGITVYDTAGWIMRAPVSTGTTGRETPAGIFTVLQKEVDHHSNLYDDAWMPHMHRITWSGIALHGGPLPGYAASHGCIRLPYDFASRLYEVTKVGMRVIISPGDVTPVEIAHPALFKPKPGAADAAAALAAEAAGAARKADEARRMAAAAAREAAQAAAPAHAAEKLKQKAEQRLAAAEQALGRAQAAEAKPAAEEEKAKAAEAERTAEEEKARAVETEQTADDARANAAEATKRAEAARIRAAETTKKAEGARARAAEAMQKAEDGKTKAAADLAAADAQLTGAKADQQARLDAAEAARKASAEADKQRTETAAAASKAARDLEPASVFISRKTQRLYVRQAFQPVLDVPVTIQDPDRPIGTHVFTATERIDGSPDLRWNVVSLPSGRTDSRVAAARTARGNTVADVEPSPAPADGSGAKAALDRITIPADVAERISGMISPRSSVIISDEALSPETGKGTEFIVVMSNEPQGGIKFRRHHDSSHHHDRSFFSGQSGPSNSVGSPFGFPF